MSVRICSIASTWKPSKTKTSTSNSVFEQRACRDDLSCWPLKDGDYQHLNYSTSWPSNRTLKRRNDKQSFKYLGYSLVFAKGIQLAIASATRDRGHQASSLLRDGKSSRKPFFSQAARELGQWRCQASLIRTIYNQLLSRRLACKNDALSFFPALLLFFVWFLGS